MGKRRVSRRMAAPVAAPVAASAVASRAASLALALALPLMASLAMFATAALPAQRVEAAAAIKIGSRVWYGGKTFYSNSYGGNTGTMKAQWVNVTDTSTHTYKYHINAWGWTNNVTSPEAKFVDWDGRQIIKQTVSDKKPVSPPPNPTRAGYVFIGWTSYKKTGTSDQTITAQYAPEPTPVPAPPPAPDPPPPDPPPAPDPQPDPPPPSEPTPTPDPSEADGSDDGTASTAGDGSEDAEGAYEPTSRWDRYDAEPTAYENGAGSNLSAEPTDITEISVLPRNISLNIGASRAIAATIYPKDAPDQRIEWHSSDVAVASVSGDGVVKAISAGSATITARAVNGIAAECKVTVYSPIDGHAAADGLDGGDSGGEAWEDSYKNFSYRYRDELSKAHSYKLAAEALRGADLALPITRLEFTAVSVKAYEALSGIPLAPASYNPFTDTDDPEALKAYEAGISIGVTTDRFDPAALLSREEAATMLARVFKKAKLRGWSFEADGDFKLQYEMPPPFADDGRISSWARDSVYFMASSGIILGTGGNMFSPSSASGEARPGDDGTATREQALLIAVRMVEKYGQDGGAYNE